MFSRFFYMFVSAVKTCQSLCLQILYVLVQLNVAYTITLVYLLCIDINKDIAMNVSKSDG